MKLAVKGMNAPESFMYVISSDWIRGTFAAGALARLLLFNVRDELALVSRGEAKPDTVATPRKIKDPCGKPLLISGLMNMAACMITPANGVFFCSWTAGWEIMSMIYTAFWVPSPHW